MMEKKIADELKNILKEIIDPFEKIYQNIAKPFIDAYNGVMGTIKGVKEAYQQMKEV